MVGNEAQLTRRLREDGCTDDEIEAVLDARADDLFERQRDEEIIHSSQQGSAA